MKGPTERGSDGPLLFNLAATYSPGPYDPVPSARRTLLPSSEWDRVLPHRYDHQEFPGRPKPPVVSDEASEMGTNNYCTHSTAYLPWALPQEGPEKVGGQADRLVSTG